MRIQVRLSRSSTLYHMQLKQDIPMLEENNNTSDNFGPHKDENSTLEKQDIKGDNKDLIDQDSDTGSHAKDSLIKHTAQDRFLVSELLSFLREV